MSEVTADSRTVLSSEELGPCHRLWLMMRSWVHSTLTLRGLAHARSEASSLQHSTYLLQLFSLFSLSLCVSNSRSLSCSVCVSLSLFLHCAVSNHWKSTRNQTRLSFVGQGVDVPTRCKREVCLKFVGSGFRRHDFLKNLFPHGATKLLTTTDDLKDRNYLELRHNFSCSVLLQGSSTVRITIRAMALVHNLRLTE